MFDSYRDIFCIFLFLQFLSSPIFNGFMDLICNLKKKKGLGML